MDSALIMGGVGCVGALIALVIVAAVIAQRRERQRQEALQHWAARHGWQFAVRPQVEWWPRMPGKNRRGVSLAMSGIVGGRPVSVAEYSYTHTTTSSGADGTSTTHSSTYHYVVFVVRLREAWPAVAVHRRGALSRFGRALFGDRATALGYEPFDGVYRVAASDPRVVRTVFGRDLVAEHVAGRLPEWSLHGTELLTFQEGRITAPDGIAGQVGALVRVADLIERPRYGLRQAWH